MASKPLDQIVGQPTTETMDHNMTEQTIVSFHPTPETESLATSTPLLSTIVIVDVVIRRVIAIIVDVRRTVAIVVDAVASRAVAIIVDIGKTPAHRQRQRRLFDEGNNAIVTTAKTPAHRQR
jgi:hypothetical protein